MPKFTKSPFNKELHTYSEENAYCNGTQVRHVIQRKI